MITFFNNLKIRHKIFVPVSLFITFLTVFLALLIAKKEKDTILEEANERSLGFCEILRYASVTPLLEGNLLELLGMVETIYSRKEVKEVVIIDTAGKIILSSKTRSMLILSSLSSGSIVTAAILTVLTSLCVRFEILTPPNRRITATMLINITDPLLITSHLNSSSYAQAITEANQEIRNTSPQRPVIDANCIRGRLSYWAYAK